MVSVWWQAAARLLSVSSAISRGREHSEFWSLSAVTSVLVK